MRFIKLHLFVFYDLLTCINTSNTIPGSWKLDAKEYAGCDIIISKRFFKLHNLLIGVIAILWTAKLYNGFIFLTEHVVWYGSIFFRIFSWLMICQKNLRVQSVTSIYNQEVNLQIHLGFCCLLQFFVRKTLTSESLTLSKQYQQLAITIFVAHQLRCLLIASKYIPFSYSNLFKRDPLSSSVKVKF